MTNYASQIDLPMLTEALKSELATARLRDFSKAKNGEGEITLTCSTPNCRMEFQYSPPQGDALPNCRRFSMQRKNPPLSLDLVNSGELREREILTLGKPLTDYFWELNSGACSAGTEVIRNAFRTDSGLRDSHLTDVSVESTGGETAVRANLILEGITLSHFPGKYSLNPANIFAHTDGDRSNCEDVTVQIELKECDDPQNPFEAAVEVTVMTQAGTCHISSSIEAKILFAALTSGAVVTPRPAVTVGELADAIREQAAVSPHVRQVLDLREKLRNALMLSLSDSPPIERGAIAEGDLIGHLRPAYSPGFSLEIYRVTELGSEVKEAERDLALKLTTRSPQGEVTEEFIRLPESEAYVREIKGAQLPQGGEGAISFFIDRDLKLGWPRVRYWRLNADGDCDVRVNANEPGSDDISCSVNDGVFRYAFDIKNPLALSLLNAFDAEGSLPAYQLPEQDSLTLKSETSRGRATLERRVPDQPYASFEAPGLWRLPPYVEQLLIQYHAALAKCTYREVMALELERL